MTEFDAMGSDVVAPFSRAGLRRARETIGWGHGPFDKARIATYYALRVLSGLLSRDHDVIRGMYPQYWIGDVRADTPIGAFLCRARTIDFDIVNPHYEAIEVREISERLAWPGRREVIFLDVGAHIGKFTILAARLLRGRGQVLAFEPEPENFRMLRANVELNRVENVRLFPVALRQRGRGTAAVPEHDEHRRPYPRTPRWRRLHPRTRPQDRYGAPRGRHRTR